jgi:S1-C subfamily serine protease
LPDGGVLVTEVESGSPSANAGLTADTILTHVGGIRVRSPAEFYEAIRNLKGTVEIKTDEEKVSVAE